MSPLTRPSTSPLITATTSISLPSWRPMCPASTSWWTAARWLSVPRILTTIRLPG